MSILSNFEDHTKHYIEEHTWGDLLSAFQIPIALFALLILFLLG